MFRSFLVLAFCGFVLIASNSSGQTISSITDGPWNLASTWSGGVIPTNANSTLVQIAASHDVNIPAGYDATAVSIQIANNSTSNLTVDANGTLSFTGTLTTGGALGSNGKLLVNGTLIVEQGATIANNSANKLVVGSTGIYRHNYSTTAGTIYNATWNNGATLEITGYTTNTSTPAGLTQTLRNFVWRCPNQQNDIYLTGNILTTVNGNFRVEDTGFFILGLDPPNDRTLDFNGSLFFGLNTFFDLNFGSFNTTVNLAGDLVIESDDALAHQGGGIATVNFDGSTVLTNSALLNTDVDFQITGTLSIPDGNFLSGPGDLTVNGTLATGSEDTGGAIQFFGGGGCLQNSGTITFNAGSTIEYSGNAPQYIGTGHPSSSGVNVVVTNIAGITLISNVTIGGNLTLTTGNVIVPSGRTLTMNGTFIAGANSINVTSTSNIVIGNSASPFGTLITSGSSTINNLIIARPGQPFTIGNNLRIDGQFTHDASAVNFNGVTLTIGNNYTPTSGSLVGDASSTLIITGLGTVGTVQVAGTLGTLTIDQPSGVVNTTTITIANRLNILTGTYSGSGSVSLSPGATIERRDGTVTKTLSATNYNLLYTNTNPITTGTELITSPATALNNLTINGANTVTFAAALGSVTVNGAISLLSGEFNSNANDIILLGNLTANATGIFTGSQVFFAGNTTLSGSALELDDIIVNSGSTLNLGSASVRIAGNVDSDNGGAWIAGTSTVTFNGNTTLTIDESNTPQFNNLTIDPSSTLVISCSSCGVDGSRPFITVSGNWNSNNTGAIFNPAPNIGGNIVNEVVFNGVTQAISTLASHSFWDLTLQGSGTVTLSQALTVANDLELGGTKTLSTSGSNFAVSVGDDFLFNGGSFTPNQATVTFNGSGNQVIDRLSGSGTVTFFNITVNKGGGTFAIETNVNLQNTFQVSSNTVIDLDGASNTDVFTLVSTATRTASIGPILSPAVPTNVNGRVTAQRHMPAQGQVYRYISTPVQNAPVSDLQNEIEVTGSFTGTSFPCAGCTNNQSMFIYQESLPGAINARYLDFPVTANSETFTAGRGYSAFTLAGASPITWDLRGTINRGTIAIPATNANDGWNLVGNPYPSAIDWQLADGATSWTRTNIDPTIYLWNESANNFATYNRSTLSGTLGGSRYISMGQAFWVLATGAPTLTAREGIKVANQPTFLRERTPSDYLRMIIADGKRQDELIFQFDIEEGTDGYDQFIDSYEFPVDTLLSLHSITDDVKRLGINAVSPSTKCAKELRLGLRGVKPGDYTIDFASLETFTMPHAFYLIDNYKGISYAISEEQTHYEFSVTDDSTSFGDNRFSLIVSDHEIKNNLQVSGAMDCGSEDGLISIIGSEPGIDYLVASEGKIISKATPGTGGLLQIEIVGRDLTQGKNRLSIYAAPQGGCFLLPLASIVEVDYLPNNSLRIDSEDGQFVSSYSEGNQWYLNGELIPGATTPKITPANSGIYALEVTVGDCKVYSEREFQVKDSEGDWSLSLVIYPNPVENVVFMEVESSFDLTARIVNAAGQQVGQMIKFTADGGNRKNAKYDVSALPSGLYLIQVSDGNSTIIKRVAKR